MLEDMPREKVRIINPQPGPPPTAKPKEEKKTNDRMSI